MRPFALLLLICCVACTGSTVEDEPQPTAGGADDALATVLQLMTGSFSSAAQAAADENYFDIRLEMAPMWQERSDGPWIYVEQAAASSLDEPYRQRVYRLSVDEAGAFVSTVYEFPDPQSHAGAWRDEAPLATLGPGDLTLREGCAVVLRRIGDRHFSGSTVEKDCISTLRGASYATSEVDVSDDGIRSWDRGYDAEDAQVWGAEAGPYVFLRSDNAAERKTE